MKKVVHILTLLLFATVYSQTHRFIYQLETKTYGITNKIDMVLDIDKDQVKFYDYNFIKMDSLSKKTGENHQTASQPDQRLIRKRHSNANISFHQFNFDYFMLPTTDEMTWTIEKENKTFQNFKLQKATTNFGGRRWTAWFTEDIPFQEGPYKFRGLPGLIFEINDADREWSYQLKKSETLTTTFDTTNFLETHYGKKPVTITLKQYQKMKLDFYNDPFSEMRKIIKEGGKVMANGQTLTTVDQLDQRRKEMQEMIRKYDNPLEKDKAVIYPKN